MCKKGGKEGGSSLTVHCVSGFSAVIDQSG
jgi:hypothetical protein